MKKVVVGIPCCDLSRYSLFYDTLMKLEGVDSRCHEICHSGTVAEARNRIAARAIEKDADYVCYFDDDQELNPDTVMQLLSHDKDIVSGVYLRRGLPFPPLIFRPARPSPCHREDDEYSYPIGWVPYIPKDGERGLVKIGAAGGGCLLVSTKVFKALKRPWFRFGQLRKQDGAEDFDFCMRAQAAGFDIWADLDCCVGHAMTVTIWPDYEDGKWWCKMVRHGEVLFRWPMKE